MSERVENTDQLPETVYVENWDQVRQLQEIMKDTMPALGTMINVRLLGDLKNTPKKGLIGNISGTKKFFTTSRKYNDGVMMVVYTTAWPG